MTKTILIGLALLASPAVAQAQTSEAAAAAQIEDETDLAAELARKDEELRRAKTVANNARQEVERLRAESALKDELVELGVERNAELYAIALEVIEQGLSRRSVEPFLQLQRVKMENLKQDYVDRAHAARIYPETLPPSVQQTTDQESTQSN